MLWMDYYVYLMELSEPERIKQVSILIIFLQIMILAGILSKFIEDRKRGN